MARSLTTLGRQLGSIAKEQAPKLVRRGAPKLAEFIERSPVVAAALGTLAGTSGRLPGRPVTSTASPTAERARRVVYAPSLDGQADPGEIVWTWVAYEEDPTRGKDRPVLVVGRDGKTLLGLMLSSNPARGQDPDWIGIGRGTWDQQGRPSWVRLDRVLDVPEAGIRREGAIVERATFDRVAHRLVADYHWR